MTPPPAVSVETVEAVMGISRAQCADQRFRRKAGLECHTPLLRVVTDDKPGLFGPSRIRFVRERLGERPVLRGRQARVARGGGHRSGSGSYSRALSRGRLLRVVRGKRSRSAWTIRRRGSNARRAAVSSSSRQRDREQPTHFVDIRLSFEVPDVETTTETRRHEYVAGKKQVPNPERPKAIDALAQAESQKCRR